MSEELKNNQEEHGLETAKEEETAGAEESGQEEQYSFLQETFKDEQNKKKINFSVIWKTAGKGLLFGAAACLTFYALKPWAESKFGKNASVVTIPTDEAEEEKDKDDEKNQEQEEEPKQTMLTIDSYREMNREIYQVAVAASKTVVQITGSQNGDWEDSDFDNKRSVSGVIFADNGRELLVLAPSRVTKDVDGFTMTFTDNTGCEASLKKQDKNLGLAVFSVERSKIGESTWGQIQVAPLGNSNIVNRGDPVITLGRQFGYAGGLGYGVISSVRNKVTVADGEYKILTTDIAAAENGSGVLFNFNGEVIGIEDQGIAGEGSKELVMAYAISDIKKCLELLSNGNAVPYLGIKGVEVNEEISQEQGIPEGIYVKEVEADSPAMQAGIQSGDVITRVGKNGVAGLSSYRNSLLECTPGEPVKLVGQRRGASGYVDIDFNVMVGSKE